MTSRIWLTSYFVTSAFNDPGMTLDTTRSNVRSICVGSSLNSRISISSVLRTSVFELHATWWQVGWMTTKLPWTLHLQRWPISVLLVSPSCKFQSATLYAMASHFKFTAHFVKSASHDHKITLNAIRSNVKHIWVTGVTECLILIRFALTPNVFELHD